LRARDEEGGVAGASELEGEFFAYAVGGTGYEGPCFGGLAECLKLEEQYMLVHAVGMGEGGGLQICQGG